jgi:hypothetical protein
MMSRIQGYCVALLLATTFFAGTAAAEVPISEKARQHFNAGVSLLQDPDGARYEEAYSEFRAAYADSPSWKICGNLGIAAMKLERDGEAIAAFKTYLKEGGANLDPEERAQFQRDHDTLSAGVVTLELTSLPPGAFVTDERIAAQGGSIKNAYGPITDKLVIGIRSGQHRFTAHLDGYQDQSWMLDARSGTSVQHTFELKKQQAGASASADGASTAPGGATSRPVPVSVFVGLGATGLLAIGAGVVGVMASGKHSDFETQNDGSNPTEAQSLKDSGQTLNLVTDALLGGAVVAGGITAVLYFTRPSVTSDRGAFRVLPYAGPRSTGLSITGAF